MRLKLISCEMFEREAHAAAARSTNHLEIHLLPETLHHLTARERVRFLQREIDRADRSSYHAVLMLVGACKPGLTGLRAGTLPVVLPRAKDCISLLLERTLPAPPNKPKLVRARVPARAVRALSEPTIAHGQTTSWILPAKTPHSNPRASVPSHESWLWRTQFGQVTSAQSRNACERRSSSLLQMLVDGYWNYSDFVVVPPGWRIEINPADGNIAAREALL